MAAKLVDLTPLLAKPENHLQLREIACQVRGSLRKLLNAAKDLEVARDHLECVTRRSLRWPFIHPKRPARLNPATLDYPKDWDTKEPALPPADAAP